MTNDHLSALLADTATGHPDREAIVFASTRLTYATVDALADQCANLLAPCETGPGDKVALSCPLTSREIAYHLNGSNAKGYGLSETSPVAAFSMQGHCGRQDATAEAIRDGWFRTGDLARRDADGWYYIATAPRN